MQTMNYYYSHFDTSMVRHQTTIYGTINNPPWFLLIKCLICHTFTQWLFTLFRCVELQFYAVFYYDLYYFKLWIIILFHYTKLQLCSAIYYGLSLFQTMIYYTSFTKLNHNRQRNLLWFIILLKTLIY